MNNFYLLLPDDSGNEFVNRDEDWNLEQFKKHIPYTTLILTDINYVKMWFDQKHFVRLLRAVESQIKDSSDRKIFRTQIQMKYGSWTDFHLGDFDKDAIVSVNGVQIADTIINAYIQDLNASVLVNPEVLKKKLYVQALSGNVIGVNVMDNDTTNLYFWLAENRNPPFDIDPNYEKHKKKPKTGKGNTVISPCSYKVEELKVMIQYSMPTDRERHRAIWDARKKVIVNFMFENLTIPTFHAFEVDDDDESEKKDVMHSQESRKRIEFTKKHFKALLGK